MLGKPDIDPVEVVFADEGLPVAHEDGVHCLGHAEHLDVKFLEPFLVHFGYLGKLLLAMAAMRVPEEDHHIFLWKVVEVQPVLLGGIRQAQVGRLVTNDQRGLFLHPLA